MTIEYRLRPVTRFAVTRFESSENAGSSRTLGEYDNKDVAYEVGYALAKAEADRLQLPVDSMEVIYPTQITTGAIVGGVMGEDQFPVTHFLKPDGRIG